MAAWCRQEQRPPTCAHSTGQARPKARPRWLLETRQPADIATTTTAAAAAARNELTSKTGCDACQASKSVAFEGVLSLALTLSLSLTCGLMCVGHCPVRIDRATSLKRHHAINDRHRHHHPAILTSPRSISRSRAAESKNQGEPDAFGFRSPPRSDLSAHTLQSPDQALSLVKRRGASEQSSGERAQSPISPISRRFPRFRDH